MDGYRATFRDLYIIVSINKESDGKVWIHASVSRRNRKTPTHEDLVTLREYALPTDCVAYEIFPPKDEYVHYWRKGQADVLHLWTCAEGRVTPDFRGVKGGI